MIEGLPWWVLPSAAALILVATHTYLGLHVISRNVFFVDLALAQVAALGSTVAFLYGYEMHDPVTYYVSLLFAVGGAWFFSFARVPDNRVPQEAIIGLTFAVASAGAILLSAENPHGAEHLRDIMAGSILVVSAKEVTQAAMLYGGIGIFQWVFRKPLLRVSFDREGAEKQGMRVQLWDFLFYLSFAVVITSSVRIAGVLLVFILLIAPAVCGAMFATGIRARLLIGWACGILATIGGLMMSSKMDWPPAPAISCIFAGILIGSAAIWNIARSKNRPLAFAKFLGISAMVIGLGFLVTTFLRRHAHEGHNVAEAPHAHPPSEEKVLGNTRTALLSGLTSSKEDVRVSAARQLGALKDPSTVSDLTAALADSSSAVKERVAEALGSLGDPSARAPLENALSKRDEDEWVVLREAEALIRCGGKTGMAVLLQLANDADARLVREEAAKKAFAFAGRPVPVTFEGPALSELGTWWKGVAAKAEWDPTRTRFVSR